MSLKDKLLLILVLIDKEDFDYRSLKVIIWNCSRSDKVNFSLEYNLHVRFIYTSLLEYLGTDSNSNE